MTRAIYYPPADRTSQWFAGAYPGSTMALNAPVIVGHTTEGGNAWPSYQGGAVAPTFTALVDYGNQRLIWRQHFPINMSARALRNLSGGVQTNTAGAVQIELCGTCVKGGPGMYWPEAPDWAIRELARFIDWFRSEWPMPQGLRLPPRGFRLFENLKGDAQRMTFDEWVNFSGVCEHQNVPENDHGDASGAWGRAVALLTNSTPPPPQEDDMPAPQDLWNYFIKVGVDKDGNAVGTSAGDLLAQMNQQDWTQTNLLKSQSAAIDGLSKAVSQLSSAAGVSVTADQIKAWIIEGAGANLTVEGDVHLSPKPAAQPLQPVTAAAFYDARGIDAPPDLDKSAPSPQDDTPGHDGPVPA